MRSVERGVQAEKDSHDLKKLGYAQELLREMGGFSNFAVSFSIISILTGSIQLFGYGLHYGGPLQMTAGWWLVSVFTMAVALSMAELASAYPTAGALYHWSSFLGGRALGWFTACLNLIGLLGVLAGVDYGLAQLLTGFFGWPNTVGVNMGVYGVILVSHAWLNHFGVRTVSWMNAFAAWYNIAVTFLLVGCLFWAGFAQPVHFLAERHSSDGFFLPLQLPGRPAAGSMDIDGIRRLGPRHTDGNHESGQDGALGDFSFRVAISAVVGYALLFAMTAFDPQPRSGASDSATGRSRRS